MSSGDEPSCSPAPNVIYYPGADEVKTQLKACLDGTRQRGTFAYKNICKEYPNPGLEIQNVGVVGLPMSSRDVEAVKQASHQAPFGKGSETIVDENVRKTWQIDASSVKFTNPRWDEWVQKHLPCEQLGVPSIAWSKVRAELYKILIYEPGAHFKQHQDSEKAPGMFATLAICLPTAHEGGELVLEHAGKQKVWKSSESSAIDLSIGAWYSDVTHEVKPVTSGHRVVLTYNIINECKSQLMDMPSASHLGDSDGKLKQVLKLWGAHGVSYAPGEKYDFLCHQLSHEYTESSLSLSRLVGEDVETINRIARVSEEAEFFVYLATLERMIEGGCDEDDDDHEIIDEIDSHWKLKKIVDLKDKIIAKDVIISKHEMVDTDYFEGEPDDEDYVGWTGNEGASTTLWYKRSVVVLMPKFAHLAFAKKQALNGSKPLAPMARDLLKPFKETPKDDKARGDLANFCLDICSTLNTRADVTRKRGTNMGGDFRMIIKGDEHLNNTDKEALIICCAWLGPSFAPDCHKVLSLVKGALSDSVLEELRQPCLGAGKFTGFQRFLIDAVTQGRSLPETMRAVKQLLGHDAFAEKDSEVLEWCRCVIKSYLQSRTDPSKEDAEALMSYFEAFGSKYHEECVLPYALERSSQPWFSFTIAAQLLRSHSNAQCPQPASWVEDAVKIVHKTINEDNFQPAEVERKRNMNRFYESTWTPTGNTLRHVDVGTVVRLCDNLVSAGKEDESAVFLKAFLKKCLPLAKEASTLYPQVLIPLAAQLRSRLAQAAGWNTIDSLLADIYASYMTDYVGPRPSKPSLALPPIKRLTCTSICRDCNDLDTFLRNGNERVWHYTAGKDRRRHVENSLWDDGSVKYETDQKRGKGNAFTLVVTKQPERKYEGKLQPWLKRAAEAKAVITSVPEDQAKRFLGAAFFGSLPEDSMRGIFGDLFEAIWRLRPDDVSSTATQPGAEMSSTPVQTTGASSTVPAKRKAEVDTVDLTDE